MPQSPGAPRVEAEITALQAAAYKFPTQDQPESDGTMEWSATTMVTVHLEAGGVVGFGYTYTDASAARLIADTLAGTVKGHSVLDPQAVWTAVRARMRNLGQPGLGACALSAIDAAVWDAKAKVLDVSLSTLLGQARPAIRAYGSGGFTSFDEDALRGQLAGWVEDGLRAVKLKVGRRPQEDLARVHAAREAVGPDVELMTDANGAYSRKEALALAQAFAAEGVTWLEEPVSSDAIASLAWLRDHGPAGLDITAGEYAWSPIDLRRLLEARAVDVLQADATRCGGVTGFLMADALCEAYDMPLSAHCAPSLHAALCCAAGRAVNLEYFHDHVRLETALLDGALTARDGVVAPDPSRPGLGLALKDADAARYAV
ncbi:Mandelate racemase [Caenispirillum salinarum AK4]|uniref:Mandelate racemase n=1 Tax=Caenispirillum salinarum AK4 TaxID=1238182 RepID=K9HU54_9PROT|nr:enolase C-terminal domain-like protein [Caenispirillum salinarum]EKV31776.1 Mandelate racemase [Caenispirillum salinarum AK4]